MQTKSFTQLQHLTAFWRLNNKQLIIIRLEQRYSRPTPTKILWQLKRPTWFFTNQLRKCYCCLPDDGHSSSHWKFSSSDGAAMMQETSFRFGNYFLNDQSHNFWAPQYLWSGEICQFSGYFISIRDQLSSQSQNIWSPGSGWKGYNTQPGNFIDQL